MNAVDQSAPSTPVDSWVQERQNLERVCEQQERDVARYAAVTQRLRRYLLVVFNTSALSSLAITSGRITARDWFWTLNLYVAPPFIVLMVLWFYYDRKHFRIESGLRSNLARLKNTAPVTSGTFPRSR